jgi:hypothetical protein
MTKRRMMLLVEASSLGGKVKGKCKSRGDKAYYSRISKKSWDKRLNGKPRVYDLIKHLKVGGGPYHWDGVMGKEAHGKLNWVKKHYGFKYEVETLYTTQDKPYACWVWRVK